MRQNGTWRLRTDYKSTDTLDSNTCYVTETALVIYQLLVKQPLLNTFPLCPVYTCTYPAHIPWVFWDIVPSISAIASFLELLTQQLIKMVLCMRTMCNINSPMSNNYPNWPARGWIPVNLTVPTKCQSFKGCKKIKKVVFSPIPI